MKRIDISIIIPAYNEEKKIKKDIEEVLKFLKRYSLTGEIIVSTDGITDNTNRIVKELQIKHSNLFLFSKKTKIGKGAAIKRGVTVAKGKVIMFADAGLCIPYKNALRGLSLLKRGFHCAFGSRALAGSNVIKRQPFYRRVGSRVFGIIVRNILHVPTEIEDTQCGFKLFKRNVAKHIFSELKTTGMMFDIEVLLRLAKHNYTMTPFPVTWRNDSDTKFNPVTGSVRNFVDLFLIKMKYRL